MRWPFHLLLLLSVSFTKLHAQQATPTDSLGAYNDSLFYLKAISVSRLIMEDPAEAIGKAAELLEFSAKTQFLKRKDASFHAEQIMAVALGRNGMQDSALPHYRQCIRIANKLGDTNKIGGSYFNLAIAYQKKGYVYTSMEYLDSSAIFREASGNALGLARSYQLQSAILQGLGEYRTSIQYAEKALRIIDSIALKNEAMGGQVAESAISSLISRGNSYLSLGEADSAFSSFDRARKKGENASLMPYVGQTLTNLADVALTRDQVREAENYSLQAWAVSQEFELSLVACKAQLRLAAVALKKGQTSSAARALDLVDSLLRVVDDVTIEIEYFRTVGKLKRQEGQFDQAFDFQEKADSLNAIAYEESKRIRGEELNKRFQVFEQHLSRDLDAGSIHTFYRDAQDVWQHAFKTVSVNRDLNDHFGSRVLIVDSKVYVGAHYKELWNAGIQAEAGMVFIFNRINPMGNNFLPEASLRAIHPSHFNHFGTSLAADE